MNAHLHRAIKIWDQAPHNAFTSLALLGDTWFCAFREAENHMSSDGRFRIITSQDVEQWSSAVLFDSPDPDLPDLRDPKIGLIPDGRLMVMGAATSRNENAPRRNYVWYSQDGFAWTEPVAIEGEGVWIWSYTWAGDEIYGAGYGKEDGVETVTLYRGREASQMRKSAVLHTDSQYPNETALLIEGGRGLAIVRREFEPGQTASPPYNNGTALLATAQFPFEEWTSRDLGVYVGGPAMLRLPSGQIVVAGRKVVGEQHYMALWQLDEVNGILQELIVLPSGNDCAYPGLIYQGDRLWVSYYSGHEGKSNIYLAELSVA